MAVRGVLERSGDGERLGSCVTTEDDARQCLDDAITRAQAAHDLLTDRPLVQARLLWAIGVLQFERKYLDETRPVETGELAASEARDAD